MADLEQQNGDGPYIPDDFMYSTKVSSCEPQVRQNFMMKVYSLLSSQLLFTFAFSYAVARNNGLQTFMFSHMALWWIAMVASVVTCIWLSFAPRAEEVEYSTSLLNDGIDNDDPQTLPWYVLGRSGKLALLSIFTLCEAYTLSVVTLVYDPDVVLRALLITAVIVIGVSLMALSPRFANVLNSATSIYYWLNWALLLLIGIGISSMFFGLGSKMNLFYGWLGAIVFTVYLFIDTQLIFRKVYPDEEIKCAMMLYLDIINLFLSILRILNNSSDDN
ncbi:similar to Saccharomyces cerevisiae YNL305C Protein involved in apoptosis [Maudiozyma barnettii]|nr:similar to Saccharomyces cerevisiae YNL305C Protein involved in apoptosis [Kazachstania barnettii]